jgi:hypothetical protein
MRYALSSAAAGMRTSQTYSLTLVALHPGDAMLNVEGGDSSHRRGRCTAVYTARRAHATMRVRHSADTPAFTTTSHTWRL